MVSCPSCGKADLAATARFCPECGAALPATAAAPEPPAPAAGTTIQVQQDVGTLAGGSATGVDLGGVSGPVTVHQQGDSFKVQLGNVGAGAQVAVGKHIQQSAAGAAAYSAADRAALAKDLERLAEALAGADLPAERQLLGGEFLRQLQVTLLNPDGPPEAATLQVCGDWLLDQIPALGPPLATALGGPAGRRALAAAGEAAESWDRARLGPFR